MKCIYQLVIAMCVAVNVPGAMAGNWASWAAAIFCTLIFLAMLSNK